MRVVNNASFRDPSGFVFHQNDILYRQINKKYREEYDFLITSGLYKKLTSANLLISHEEVDISNKLTEDAYKIIRPYELDFISYPYEWSFSQLKDAAITTLEIQKIALEYNMILKDASAYNIQFKNGKPTLIDTLSFEKYGEGNIWTGYRQFCQHFLAPLSLMTYKDIRLSQLLKLYIDGIPLDLASNLLPKKSYFNLGILAHIHIHANSQKKYEYKNVDTKKLSLKKSQLMGLISNLINTINNLNSRVTKTEWGDYYNNTNYSDKGFFHKKQLVDKYLKMTKASFVWDIGANMGEFSRIASAKGIKTIAFDIDPVAVEKNYLKTIKDKEENLLPLLLDLTNPSPPIGWNNEERMSFKERKIPDTIFALALIHHLAISNNIPLRKIAEFFSHLCTHLIIEFVPKEDSQVQVLLSTRKDIFTDYTKQHFEDSFCNFFEIIDVQEIDESKRNIYLFKVI